MYLFPQLLKMTPNFCETDVFNKTNFEPLMNFMHVRFSIDFNAPIILLFTVFSANMANIVGVKVITQLY